LRLEGEDLAQDGVIFRMDHHLVLILVEVLDQIAMTGVAKVRIMDFLGNSCSSISSEKWELDASGAMALSLS